MRSKWGKQVGILMVAAMCLSGVSARGQAIMYMPDSLQWTDGPASLLPGAKVVVVKGDPTQPGLFTMRLKFPANYKVQPHSHTADEHVTVISGALHVGVGETFDPAIAKTLPVGAFMVMPVGTKHFAWTEQETIIQLHGMGPWRVIYVNPEDDPRNK